MSCSGAVSTICKALGITPRTLEVGEQMGVLEDALRRGRFNAGITASVNREAAGVETVQLGSMPYGFLLLAQYDTEEILRRHLARSARRAATEGCRHRLEG